jgi:hypothetical protein
VVKYRETVWSDVFPGNFHTVHALQPAVRAAENALELALKRRKRTVWRLDGGSGSEQKLRWIVKRGYHILAKGINYNRAKALGRRVRRWDPYGDTWIGEAPAPQDYPRPVRVFVKRRLSKDTFHYTYYVTTLSLPAKGKFMDFYNARGGSEVEQFRNDKQGLSLATRRKQDYLAQVAYVLLADLAHNLLADFSHKALCSSKFADYGLKRIVRDLLAMPGKLVFEGSNLRRVELLSQKQNSKALQKCLLKYVSGQKS